MISPGDRVRLVEPLTTPGGFFSGPRVVVREGAVGVVRRAAGVFRPMVVAFPDGFGLTDHEVPARAVAAEEAVVSC